MVSTVARYWAPQLRCARFLFSPSPNCRLLSWEGFNCKRTVGCRGNKNTFLLAWDTSLQSWEPRDSTSFIAWDNQSQAPAQENSYIVYLADLHVWCIVLTLNTASIERIAPEPYRSVPSTSLSAAKTPVRIVKLYNGWKTPYSKRTQPHQPLWSRTRRQSHISRLDATAPTVGAGR